MRIALPAALSAAFSAVLSAALLTVCSLAVSGRLPVTPADTTATAPTPAQQARFDEARQAFREAHYARAYGRLAALADAGHAPSAQIALVMHRRGGALFGSEWSATPWQQERWAALVINAARQRMDIEDDGHGD